MSVDTAEGLEKLARRLARSRAPGPVSTDYGVDVRLDGELHPRIRATAHGAPRDLTPMMEAPEWRRFARPFGDRSRRLYAPSWDLERPIVEAREDEFLVLDDRHWSLYASLAFTWHLLREHPVMLVHGACLSHAGRAFVLIGRATTGKSTLAWAMHQEGADYFGDERVYFTLPDRRLHAQTRDLQLRTKGIELLRRAAPNGDLPEPETDGSKSVAATRAPEKPCPNDVVNLLFMDGFAEQPLLSRMDTGDAAVRLVSVLSYGDPSLDARLDAAAGLLDGQTCWRLAAGDPAQTARLVLEGCL